MQQIETSEQSQQNFKDIQVEVKPLKSKFRLENLEGLERLLVLGIDDFMRSYKPKKIISQKVCINQQAFWVEKDKINPEIVIKVHEFITVGCYNNIDQPLKANESINRNFETTLKITLISSQEHSLLSALHVS